MAKQTKPKCGKGQSCGYACIEIKDTCREKISERNAAKLIGVIDNLSQYKDKAVRSFSDSDKGKTFDELAAKYPFKAGEGIEEKIGKATVWHLTMDSSDGSGDKLAYSIVQAGTKSYTVSDGLIKEYLASDRNGLFKEGLAAAIRAKVEADAVKAEPQPTPNTNSIDVKLDRSKVPFSRVAAELGTDGATLPKWAENEAKGKSIPVVTDMLKGAGFSDDEAYKSAVSLKNWLGSGYDKMSKLTFLSDEETDNPENVETRAVLGMAIKALKALPPVTLAELEESYSSFHKAKGITKPLLTAPEQQKPLSRWIKLTPKDTFALTSKYKKGEIIEENGMFGTTHLSAEQMSMFSYGATVQYIVNPKLDGTGGGRAVDKYKNTLYEGEVLYVPGTKFKVDKVVYSSRDMAKYTSPDKLSKYVELLDESSLRSRDGRVRRKQLWGELGEKPYQYTGSNGKTIYYSDKDIDDIVAKVGSGTKADANKLLQAAGLPTYLVIVTVTGVKPVYGKADSRIAPPPDAKVYLTEV